MNPNKLNRNPSKTKSNLIRINSNPRCRANCSGPYSMRPSHICLHLSLRTQNRTNRKNMLYCVLTCLATVCSYAVRRALSLFFASGVCRGGGVSIYIYICIYVYMYICIYVYMYICIYVYMYICIYVYMYICIYVYMYICIYVYMYICIYNFFIFRVLPDPSSLVVPGHGQARERWCQGVVCKQWVRGCEVDTC